jgi:hypothetical protein
MKVSESVGQEPCAPAMLEKKQHYYSCVLLDNKMSGTQDSQPTLASSSPGSVRLHNYYQLADLSSTVWGFYYVIVDS